MWSLEVQGVELAMTALYPNTGQRRISTRYQMSNIRLVPDEQLLVMLCWPRRKFPFLAVRATAAGTRTLSSTELGNTSQGLQIGDARQRLEELQARLGRHASTFEHRFLTEHHWVADIVSRTDGLYIHAVLNTDIPEFAEAVRGLEQQVPLNGDQVQWRLPLAMYVYGVQHEEQSTVDIPLRVATRVPAFDGCVSIDFGNTSTAVARIEGSALIEETYTLPDVPYDESLANVRLAPGDHSIPSILRIQHYPNMAAIPREQIDTYRNNPRFVKYDIGANASSASDDLIGLILSPKRLLSAPTVAGDAYETASPKPYRLAAKDPVTKQVLHQEVSPTWPAEMYFRRLLQVFRAIHLANPVSLAITYPTSYSPIEVERLRMSMRAAWRWLQRSAHDYYSVPEGPSLLEIDEASAAAFGTLVRRHLKSPGALLSFRYLYPSGFHMLLYDCGGATTDIALVQAIAPSPNEVHVKVLGRSGVRDFGGDDITAAVFRVLKFRLARALSSAYPALRRVPDLPTLGPTATEQQVATFKRVLSTDAANVNSIVPTQFDPHVVQEDQAMCQRNALHLWHWAEEVKRRLQPRGVSTERALPAAAAALSQSLAACHANTIERHNTTTPNEVIRTIMENVPVTYREVTCQIEEKLAETIDCCNALIRHKLYGIAPGQLAQHLAENGDEPETPLTQVDCVSVVGNASRFPFIQEKLTTLRIPLLNDAADSDDTIGRILCGRKFDFHEDELKTAVARGAALALYYDTAVQAQMRVVFSKAFCNLLPYNVGYHNLAVQAPVRLFAEGTHYEELGQAEVPVVDPVSPQAANGGLSPGQGGNILVLLRQWPGAKQWTPLGQFQFRLELEGKVIVEYDMERHQFRAITHGEQVWLTPHIDDRGHLSPVQRGEL